MPDTNSDGSITPRPDPTVATNDAVDRAIISMRQYVDGQLDVRDERLAGIDRATELRLAGIEGIPTQIDEKVSHLKDLQNEKFASVAQQFVERDVRSDQQAAASAQALAAALQAAKELVGAQGEASAAAAVKSETSFTKQIDQIGTIIQTLEKALDARITELKERIDRGEGNNQGARETRQDAHEEHQETRAVRNESRMDQGQLLAVFVAVIALAGLALSLATR